MSHAVIQVQAYPRVTHAHPTKALSVVSSSLAQAMRRLLVGVALATSIVFTQAPPSFADGAPFSRKLKQNTTIISNELSETSVQEEIQINEQAIVGQFGQITVPVNEHFTDAQIVEAATIKADGRRLDVPQDKILVSSQPNAPFLGIFMADVKFRTIVFPDVAAGDKVYYAVRSRGRNPLGGGFQLAWAVTPAARFDEVSITLDLPAEMSLHTAMAGFAEHSEERNGRRRITWTLGPQPYQADEPGSVSPLDWAPHLVASTYPDWDALGHEFYKLVAPASEPSEAIRAKADAITEGITDRRKQAQAIFDWVSANVRYFGIFLGQGGFEPHSAESVLSNKYGDCKDHATLMRALLAAKGIDAEYVIINLAPVYQDYAVPAALWFNHVILYLPEFDIYSDPTASLTSYDVLVENEADKPALRVGRKGVRFVRTPPVTAENNRLSVKADVTVKADGALAGTETTEAAGPIAASLRLAMANAAIKGGETYVKERLGAMRWNGTGTLQRREATDHTEPYTVTATFDLTPKILLNGKNANPIPVVPRFVEPPQTQYLNALKEKRTRDFWCIAQVYEQTIDLHFPDAQTLTNLPSEVKAEVPLASYNSIYRLEGQTLHVKRRLVIRPPRSVCSPQMAKEMLPVLEAANKDYGYRPQFSAPSTSLSPL